MAEYTANYNLILPTDNEYYSVEDANNNAELIDSAIKANADGIEAAITEVETWAKGTFSNPNLLTNGDFQVWQRGESFTLQGAYGASKYTADRWLATTWDTGTIIVNKESDNSLYFSYDGNLRGQIKQVLEIENTLALHNKQVTASFEIEILSGNEQPAFALIQHEAPGTYYANALASNGINSTTSAVIGTPSQLAFMFTVHEPVSFRLKWVKLELGSAATPFVPRPYGEELALCKRYYQKISGFFRVYGYNVNTLYTHIPIPIQMRTSPTGSVIDTSACVVWSVNRVQQSGFTFPIGSSFPTFVTIDATKTSHGLTDGYLVISGYTLQLDAEIY
ncbi:MAG: hypothetical protein VB018_13335 [Lachnospiraceae bacterium]|nr:hypothetical protein [Lachnospiraceae bacterium]